MASEANIRLDVLAIYIAMAKAYGRDVEEVNASSKLETELRFNQVMRALMAKPLNQLIQRENGNKIFQAEAAGLKTIKDAADLVWKRINNL